MSTSSLVYAPPSALTHLEFSKEQVGIIKSNFCAGFSESEFSYCMSAAASLGANPILKECYFLPQNYQDKSGKWHRRISIQIGIDFYRRRALETGRLRGIKISWGDPEGNWYDLLPANRPLYAAKCTLYVNGMDIPIERIAYWEEFGEAAKSSNPIWRSKSKHMLAKVAEAQAIRVLCAGQLGGTYTPDEMGVEDVEAITVQITPTPASKAQPQRELGAPSPVQHAEPKPATKSPEKAKRGVLEVVIKEAFKNFETTDGKVDAKKVRQTISCMSHPGPIARVWPDFPKWSISQLEELAGLYDEMGVPVESVEVEISKVEEKAPAPAASQEKPACPF